MGDRTGAEDRAQNPHLLCILPTVPMFCAPAWSRSPRSSVTEPLPMDPGPTPGH